MAATGEQQLSEEASTSRGPVHNEQPLVSTLGGTGPLQATIQPPLTASLGANQTSGAPQYFLLSVLGQLESAEGFVDCSDLFCKFNFVYGQDWVVTMGIEEGITQVALRNASTSDWSFAFNFPLEIAFKSTNPYGWPRIVLSLYGRDTFGSDVVRGYTVAHVPLPSNANSTNNQRLRLPCFTPESSSPIQRFLGLLQSRRPEYHDPTMLGRADASGHQARQVTRVSSLGWVTIRLTSVVKDLRRLGYTTSSRSDAAH